MPNKSSHADPGLVAVWAKRCYLAGRSAMEATLRPYDLGATQWYVLHHLAEGPTMQRELLRMLQVERATLSGIVATLVRKGLVERVGGQADQRQNLLRMTPAGKKLWAGLPDLTFLRTVAFKGIDRAQIAAAVDVLKTATERLEDLTKKEGKS